MNKKNSPQRKTTLKWNSNGELSEIDMLRILEKISSHDLNQCELTCDSCLLYTSDAADDS